MRWAIIIFFSIFMAGLIFLVTRGGSAQYPHAVFTPAPVGMSVIAHAGGGRPEGLYSNSRQAFDHSAKAGFDFIEADFSLAQNGDIVLIHSWGLRHHQYFSPFDRLPYDWKKDWQRPARSAAHFKSRKMKFGLTQMSLDDLFDWMDTYPGPKIVTDAKTDNMAVLSFIAKARPDLQHRFVPQIYSAAEYAPVQDLGYTDIIYTAYQGEMSEAELITFAQNHRLLALTIPVEDLTPEIAAQTEALGVPLWVHKYRRATPMALTNSPEGAKALADKGVDGIYTDFLIPPMTVKTAD